MHFAIATCSFVGAGVDNRGERAMVEMYWKADDFRKWTMLEIRKMLEAKFKFSFCEVRFQDLKYSLLWIIVFECSKYLYIMFESSNL